jgi:hypothetical protein
MGRRVTWLAIYAVAMAFVESAVVVYLRALYYPQGFDFPLVPMRPGMIALEIGREAATLIMLLGVAALAGADRWECFLAFCLSFGIWDIFYYAWLWIFIRWPPSLFTWGVLFLIPGPLDRASTGTIARQRGARGWLAPLVPSACARREAAFLRAGMGDGRDGWASGFGFVCD